MRLHISDRATGIARQTEVHTWLIQNNAAYAQSVKDGQTLRWAIPMQEDDGTWFIAVKPKVFGALTAQEYADIHAAGSEFVAMQEHGQQRRPAT